jgi:hypothetical protein
MEIDLLELFSRRRIVHPTRILSVVDADGDVRVLLSGCRWWLTDHSQPQGAYEFRFEKVSHGNLSVNGAWDSEANEDLNDFRIAPLQDPTWAGKVWQIFCSSPLTSTIDLYARLEKYLADSDSFLRAWDFLNCSAERPLGSFNEISQSSSYLLARCPESVRDLLAHELSRQKVKYNILACKDYDMPALLRVRFNGSDFLCASARAILPDSVS